MDNHDLPFFLFMFPWLWLVGAPFLTRSASLAYWDASSFVLRFLALCCCEALLCGVLAFCLWLPFVGNFAVMQSGTRGTVESAAEMLVWFVVAGIIVAGTWRAWGVLANRR